MRAKYVRIQGRELSFRTKKTVGIFSVCWRLIRNNIFTAEEEQLFVSIDNWFKKNLAEPPFYQEDNPLGVITYFKVETTEFMLERLEPLCQLFDKYHYEYDIVYTNYVGNILYEDEYQVAVVEGGKKVD